MRDPARRDRSKVSLYVTTSSYSNAFCVKKKASFEAGNWWSKRKEKIKCAVVQRSHGAEIDGICQGSMFRPGSYGYIQDGGEI